VGGVATTLVAQVATLDIKSVTSFRRHLESGGLKSILPFQLARCKSVLRTRTYFCWLGGRRGCVGGRRLRGTRQSGLGN
jgi:hypothetical protein